MSILRLSSSPIFLNCIQRTRIWHVHYAHLVLIPRPNEGYLPTGRTRPKRTQVLRIRECSGEHSLVGKRGGLGTNKSEPGSGHPTPGSHTRGVEFRRLRTSLLIPSIEPPAAKENGREARHRGRRRMGSLDHAR